jgi:hypothetical protein
VVFCRSDELLARVLDLIVKHRGKSAVAASSFTGLRTTSAPFGPLPFAHTTNFRGLILIMRHSLARRFRAIHVGRVGRLRTKREASATAFFGPSRWSGLGSMTVGKASADGSRWLYKSLINPMRST